MQYLLEETKNELKLRNYSRKTIKSYLYCLKKYFSFKKVNPDLVNIQNIKQFLLQKQKLNLAESTINLYLNLIKFFYREITKVSGKINIKFAKRNKKLPVTLSRKEILYTRKVS